MRRAFSSSVFLRNPVGDVLLVFHKRLKFWLPVGGEREGDESPIETAIREVAEETGIELSVTDFPRVHTTDMPGAPPGLLGYEEHDAGPERGRHLNFVFLANVGLQTDIKLSSEHAGYRWFDRNWAFLNTERYTTPNVEWCLRFIANMRRTA